MVDSAWSNERWLRPLLAELLGQEPLASLAAEGRPLWESVVSAGLLTDQQIVDAVAARFRLPIADVRAPNVQARGLLAERWARKYRVIPLRAGDGALHVATADPLNLDCERALGFASGRPVRFALASPMALSDAIESMYRAEPPAQRVEVQHLTADIEGAPPAEDPDDPASATRLVDDLIGEGISARVSDIHIEPEESGIVVRHRVDGVLRPVRTLPRAVAPSLVSRFKILCGLDIADRLRPQDGRARVAVNGVAVDLRVSTLPASHGEKIAVRVLDSRGAVIALEGMGFLPDEQARIERLLEHREGLILVTGPTGSGKTTTLYAALRRLQETGVNIVTVEDPIEYRLPGIVQVQVNERAGLTFASALRSIMRQDPDVLLIGEIRDRETAEIAIQASLTGHLVFSTLHTNDAASAVTRLSDVGIAPYKIATAVKGVIAQRLVRRRCSCRAGQRAQLLVAEPAPAPCRDCGGAGYRGRLAVVEVLLSSPEFERGVATGEPSERLAEHARAGGMRSLWESGMEHVALGHTSQAELLRVATPPVAVDARLPAHYLPKHPNPGGMTERAVPIEVATIDVYVIRKDAGRWEVLTMQRASDTRCPGSWEVVHGRIEPGELPEDAATRELREETGLDPRRLYAVTVQPFYMLGAGVVSAAVVFAAFVDKDAEVRLAGEHAAHAWLSPDVADRRLTWPRSRAALREIIELFARPDFATVEDVLLVR